MFRGQPTISNVVYYETKKNKNKWIRHSFQEVLKENNLDLTKERENRKVKVDELEKKQENQWSLTFVFKHINNKTKFWQN